jgi:NADH-quinone oxidoreductase subunit N
MFFTDPVQDGTSVEIPSSLTRIAIIFSIVLTMALGIYPTPLLDFITSLATFIR